MRKSIYSFLLFFATTILHAQPHVIVLGTAQDGGFPHLGCQNECQQAFTNPEIRRFVVSLALVDPQTNKWWLFEATPDFDDQLQLFQTLTNGEYPYLPDGIFITHAHIGHYTGLMSLGREVLSAHNVKVYTLPKMSSFLASNGPWDQLVKLKNIRLVQLSENKKITISEDISLEAFTVPHRDEYSETAGFSIQMMNKSFLFIPDIDKWEKWERSIVEEVKQTDFAFIDATFFKNGELPNRNMSEVPHPFIEETMRIFKDEPLTIKSKVHFIHFNHTNPVLFDKKAIEEIQSNGFNVAEQGRKYD